MLSFVQINVAYRADYSIFLWNAGPFFIKSFASNYIQYTKEVSIEKSNKYIVDLDRATNPHNFLESYVFSNL